MPAFFDNEGRDKLLWATDIPDTDWELVLVLDKSTPVAPLSPADDPARPGLLVLVGSIPAISWLVGLLLGPLTRCPRPWPASPTETAIRPSASRSTPMMTKCI